MSSPIRVALGVDLPEPIVQQVRAVSPRVALWTAAELARDPDGYRGVEVALVAGWGEPERFSAAPTLRWVQSVGAGVERLLATAIARRPEVVLTNGSGLHAQPIAEHVFGFLLSFTRNLHLAFADQPRGRWSSERYRETLGTLRGKTLGVLGLGAIGLRVAEIANAFGLRVIGLKRQKEPVAGVAEVYGSDEVDEFLARSELLVNILPLTPATRGWLGRRELALLPRGAFFVNVGRGATVDTEALVEALRSGHLVGAGLDVTEPEPLPAEHPLWTLPNVLITPHYSGAQPNGFKAAGELFVENLGRYVRGEPLLNVVDKQAGY